MVALELQIELAKEIEVITKDIVLHDPNGEVEQLKAFKQSLPIKTDDESEDPYPYCIVRLMSGLTPDAMSAQEVKIILILGIYDDGVDAQGHQSILNIIQRIQERFFKNPVLANQFIMQQKYEWTLQDDDSYPYYFGGIEVAWTTSSIRREDDLA
jgi:hypothetical protein